MTGPRLIEEGQQAWQDAEPRLRPLLRLTIYAGAAPAAVVRVPFLPHLFAYVAIEEEEGTRLVQPEEATGWGKTFQQLLAHALEALRGLDDLIELSPTNAREPVLSVGANDELQSSRLLQPGWLSGFSDVVEGTPICAVPSWGTCLISGDASQVALEEVFDRAERQFVDNPEAISPVVYTVTEESLIVPLSLPDDHPLAGRVGRAEALLLARAYEEQRAALELGIEQEGAALRVAECRLLPHEGGRLLTATTHVRGVDSLLPVTDVVGIAWQDGDTASFLVVWTQDLIALAPRVLLRDSDHDPPRYRTIGFPQGPELEALGVRALASADHPVAEIEETRGS